MLVHNSSPEVSLIRLKERRLLYDKMNNWNVRKCLQISNESFQSVGETLAMAMVMNNNAAMMTLGELNKNISQLGKDLKKVSTGMKINGAGDDASGYAISERMQVRIRSLNQDECNVQTGTSMLKVAAGGIESIIEELRSLKELAINAANDTNTTLDRVTIQREFDQRRANIDSIAVETNYNGKILLMGDYGNKIVEVTKTTVMPGTPGSSGASGIPGSSWLNPTNPSAVGPTGAVVHSGAVEPTGTPVQITSNSYTISQGGVYELTDNSHNITINSGVHDVKFVQAAGATLTNVHITGPLDGNANLWIEDLSVTNSDNSSFIAFQGASNVFNFKGTNNIKISGGNTDYAVIHVGGGLTVEGGAGGSGAITFEDSVGVYGALIGSTGGNHGLAERNLTSPITVNSGNYTSIVTAIARYGAVIGAGQQARIGDLIVNGGFFNDSSVHDVTIGCGSADSKCGNITVKNITLTALNKSFDTSIGSDSGGTCGNIYVSNSNIHINNQTAAGIGSAQSGTCGNITVENTELVVSSVTGAGIGTGENGRAGNIIINNCDLTQVVSERGEYVGRGVNGIVESVTVNGAPVAPDDPANQPGGGSGTLDTPGTPDQIVTETYTKVIGRPLIILDGTKSNQEIHFYINDMRTSALKGEIVSDSSGEFINPEDLDRLRNLQHDPAAYRAYVDLLREANGMTLDEVSVTTQHGASVGMRVIDGAIQYALDEATTVGAYISRLEYTADNIVTSNENTVSSESTIRDADMAKEMTAYTKSNVLAQAAQSMLAQANQNSSSVLSLLQ